VQANSTRASSQIQKHLEDVMAVLDDEARGVPRIKRPFTLILEQRYGGETDTSNPVSNFLNPARFAMQTLVIIGLVFVIMTTIGLTRTASSLYGIVGLCVCAVLFVCDLVVFTREWRRPKGDGSNTATTEPAKPKCCSLRWFKGKLSTISSVLLFIVGSCFAWQTPFKTTALNNELQAQLWRGDGTSWTGFDGADALLYRIGMFMIVLLFLRNISGDKLRDIWGDMASFNAQRKMDEVQFVAMEFLLIGYVMLVSAATQPMACHTDLDSKVKLSADNSIECDFCQENAGIAVWGTAHTYGWLWKCALLCSILYSAGLPLFFFSIIWKYAGSQKLHTKGEFVTSHCHAFLTSGLCLTGRCRCG